MLDCHGRKVDYLRVSLTDRCNLRCIYCMPKEGIKKKDHEEILRFEEIIKIVKSSVSLGIKKIRYTGGEPLILKGMDRLIYETSKIPGIEDLSITTNGILLNEAALELKKAGLRRVNISLDTLKEDKYRYITRGGDINKVISAIDKCLSIGLEPVKINVVLMKGINDTEIYDFIDLIKSMPIQIRFIELMPIGEALNIYESCFMKVDEIINNLNSMIPVTAENSSTAKVYRFENSKGTIGFISPMSCKFCSNCNRIRLTAGGTIKPCLHSEKEIEIKSALDDEIKLKSLIKEAILNKPMEHFLDIESQSRTHRMMYQIGG